MRILDRYIARVFIGSYAICFFFFIGLFLIVDFFNSIEAYLEARESIRGYGHSVFATISMFYLLSIPFIFQQVAPFITLMAAMFTVTRLLKTNELYPMVHAGQSLYRVLAPVIALTVMLTGLILVSQELLIPELSWRRSVLGRLCEGLDPSTIEKIDTITDRNGDRIRIGSFDAKSERIRRLDVTHFDRMSELRADTADYRDGQWLLSSGGVPRDFDQIAESSPLVEVWETDITPNDIRLATEDKTNMSFSQLLEIYRRNPERIQLLTLMHHKITFPLSNVVLLLLGFWTILRRRNQSVFLGIAMCMIICAAYFATDFVAQAFGNRGSIHPVLATWLPLTLFGSLGISLYPGIRT